MSSQLFASDEAAGWDITAARWLAAVWTGSVTGRVSRSETTKRS